MAGSKPVVAGPTLDTANSVALDLELRFSRRSRSSSSRSRVVRPSDLRPPSRSVCATHLCRTHLPVPQATGPFAPGAPAQCGLYSGTRAAAFQRTTVT